MKTLSRRKFIAMIKKKRSGYKIQMEDREKLGYRTYGVLNHAEFLGYMNPHDDCLWDIIIPGYSYKISKKIHYINDIIGYIWVDNGNHKIIVDLDLSGFDGKQFIDEITYFRRDYGKLNRVSTKLVLF